MIAQAQLFVLCTVAAEAIITLSGGLLCGSSAAIWNSSRSDIRLCLFWASQVLPSESDSFDSRHVLHLRRDGRPTERPLLDTHSRRRRVSRDALRPVSNRVDGRNKPILTTMMLAGHRLVRVYGFGVQRKVFSPKVIVWAVFVGLETEDMCVEDKTVVVPEGSILLATPVSSPDRGFDERETFGPL